MSPRPGFSHTGQHSPQLHTTPRQLWDLPARPDTCLQKTDAKHMKGCNGTAGGAVQGPRGHPQAQGHRAAGLLDPIQQIPPRQ